MNSQLDSYRGAPEEMKAPGALESGPARHALVRALVALCLVAGLGACSANSTPSAFGSVDRADRAGVPNNIDRTARAGGENN